jgi:hypothetical protein
VIDWLRILSGQRTRAESLELAKRERETREAREALRRAKGDADEGRP